MNEEFITDEEVEDLVKKGWVYLHCEDCEATYLVPPSNPVAQAMTTAGLRNEGEGILINKEYCSRCNPFRSIDLSGVPPRT